LVVKIKKPGAMAGLDGSGEALPFQNILRRVVRKQINCTPLQRLAGAPGVFGYNVHLVKPQSMLQLGACSIVVHDRAQGVSLAG
jgi:hypothetical protein